MKKILFMLLIVLAFSFTAGAQEVSEKKEVAIFALSYYGWNLPSNVIGGVDAKIKDVFIKMKRFKVLGMTKRLGTRGVDEFIEFIRAQKEQNMEIDDKYIMGEETFTRNDLNEILGSFVVVIPVISYYGETWDEENAEYDVEIEVSFTFIDVTTLQATDSINMTLSASHQQRDPAIKEALDDIPMRLTFELRSIPMFQLRTGVTDIKGATIELELGKNMGIKKGDEFAIINNQETGSGRIYEEETALVLIKEVHGDFSEAQLIYADPPPVIGDAMKEIPRLGIDGSFFVHGILNSGFELDSSMIGVKTVASRGFYDIRFLAELAVPINEGLMQGLFFPAHLYAGVEYNIIMGRLRITPMIAGGIGALYPYNDNQYTEDFYISHLGVKGFVTLNYLLGRDARFYVEGGFYGMAGFYETLFPSVIGPGLGAGFTLKL